MSIEMSLQALRKVQASGSRELLEGFLEQVSAHRLQVVAQEIAEPEVLFLEDSLGV